MPKYLHRETTKHLTRYHYLAPDGIHPLSKHCPQVEVGKRGWHIIETDEPTLINGQLCWWCFDEAERRDKPSSVITGARQK